MKGGTDLDKGSHILDRTFSSAAEQNCTDSGEYFALDFLALASINPSPLPCVLCRKKRLTAEYIAAISACLKAESEQLKSVALGEEFGFEAEIKAAKHRRIEAKHAVLKHQTEHGC